MREVRVKHLIKFRQTAQLMIPGSQIPTSRVPRVILACILSFFFPLNTLAELLAETHLTEGPVAEVQEERFRKSLNRIQKEKACVLFKVVVDLVRALRSH